MPPAAPPTNAASSCSLALAAATARRCRCGGWRAMSAIFTIGDRCAGASLPTGPRRPGCSGCRTATPRMQVRLTNNCSSPTTAGLGAAPARTSTSSATLGPPRHPRRRQCRRHRPRRRRPPRRLRLSTPRPRRRRQPRQRPSPLTGTSTGASRAPRQIARPRRATTSVPATQSRGRLRTGCTTSSRAHAVRRMAISTAACLAPARHSPSSLMRLALTNTTAHRTEP
mmetsp:Transcript_22922/g.65551  ORF Transcript_22922/g.65551 Transcript_22922/m.65551 type:complete len:226 (-) Transcript_22922:1699-2376(-)